MAEKPFQTYDEQITILQTKGLNIVSNIHTKALLQKHSYFNLIIGYKTPFKDESTGLYKKNCSIDDIHSLYMLDSALRSVFLKNILTVENYIKSLISYAFCEKYGNSQACYLDRQNYSFYNDVKTPIQSQHNCNINTLITKLKHILSNNTQYSYLKHQKERYENIPLWALIKASTMGVVASMYALLPQALQVNVSRCFVDINETMLVSMLDLLARVRNVCAHNERLYDYKYQKGLIPDTYVHQKLAIPQKKTQYVKGKKDLFAVVIALKYLLDKKEFASFFNELDESLERFHRQTSQIQAPQLQKLMGFPSNWKNIELL